MKRILESCLYVEAYCVVGAQVLPGEPHEPAAERCRKYAPALVVCQNPQLALGYAPKRQHTGDSNRQCRH